MTSMQNDEKSMLKSAQFRSLLINNKKATVKDIESILEGVDANFKVLDRQFPEKRDRHLIGSTLLHLAYRHENIEAYIILIRKGADFTVKNGEGNTVLHEIFDFYAIFSCWYIKKDQGYLFSKKIPFLLSTLSAHVQSRNNNNPASPKGLTHFHIACATNNLEAVKFFLCNGVSVNEAVTKAISNKYFKGYTPLHFTALYGCHEVTKILLKYGAIKNKVDANGKTPLDIAVVRNIAMINSKTKVHSDIEIIDNEKIILSLWSPLCTKLPLLSMISAMHNSLKTKSFLTGGCQLSRGGVNCQDVNQCMSMDSPIWPGYRALHFAAHVNVKTVEILIRHGADIEAKDTNGVTPFDICVERYKAEDIADIIRLVPKWMNILLSDGQTKLTDLLMAFKDLNETRNFLEKSDANVTLFVPFDSPLWPGFTVLHIAVLFSARKNCILDYKKKGQQEGLRRTSPREELFQPDLTIVTECLKQDADVTAKDHRGWTPIHFAFRLEREMVLELLLQYHHRMKNSIDNENLSHLHIACAVENRDLVKTLLWNGANINLAYEGESPISCVYPGWTPLHIAVYKNNCEITKLLLKFGADVHAIDRDGFTPIHGLKSQEISRMLFGVSNLSDFVVKDLGLSYLHVACSIHNVDAVKRLLDLGADVNKVITCKIEWSLNFHNHCRNNLFDGDTPLHCALKNSLLASPDECTSELLNLLLERGADMIVKNSHNTCLLNNILDDRSDELLNVALKVMKSSDDFRKRAKMETGLSMLHLACCKLDVDLVKELLDDGADVDAKIHDDASIWSGGTPLHVLIFTGKCDDNFEKILKLLLDRGADVTLTNTRKRTPLHIAYRNVYADSDASTARVNSLRLMLKAHKNFEVNPTSLEGVSYFHIACHVLDVDIVEKFLEHDVDVNSTIDVYYNWNIAGSTPLLLTARTINYGGQAAYSKSLSESLAQLKIVDLLIKRGARVNVEDICGNTPAHYASFGNSSKENLLERLAKSGADVNARNLRGETPLELLLKEGELTLEEIRVFIACGCLLNSFNSFTEDGYIGMADSLFSHEDMQRLLFGTFVNSPDLMKRDRMDRTVIHNMVSSNHTQSYEENFIDLYDISIKFGCDIDEQDTLGRTALHLAAQFQNKEAIAGLLLVGADINITDNDGKTPFVYVFEAFGSVRSSCDNSEVDHDQYAHFELFNLFVTQIRKLQLCNLDLHKSNERLLSKTLEMFKPDDFDSQIVFLAELEEMSKLKVEPYSISLADFISDAVVINYPLMSQDKRKAIDEYFLTNKDHFRIQFKQAVGIFQLQCRQAVLRRKIIDEAKDSLTMLMNLRLPDICSHIVLRLLKNSELQNLILSVS